MSQVAGEAIRVVHYYGSNRFGVHQVAELTETWPLHRRPGDSLIDQDVSVGDRIALMCSELLTVLNLRGNREPFALVLGAHPGIDGSISLVVSTIAALFLHLLHPLLLTYSGLER